MPNETPHEDSPVPQTNPPSSGLRWLIYAGLFMLIGMMILIYIGRDVSTIVNAPMPDLDLAPIGRVADKPTNDNLKDKVVVFHFWGTWCPPCMAEYPEFYEVYKHFQNNPQVEFISVSCESESPANLETLTQETEQFLKKMNTPMPTYADPAVYTRAQITKMLSAGGFVYPSTLLVDQAGTVRYLWRGYAQGGMKELQNKINLLLQSPPENH